MTIINDKSVVVYENGIGQFEKKMSQYLVV